MCEGYCKLEGRGGDCSSLTLLRLSALKQVLASSIFVELPAEETLRSFLFHSAKKLKSRMWGGDSASKGECSTLT